MQKHSRRRFLKHTPAFVAVAGAATLATSCSTSPTSANQQDNKTTSLQNVKLDGPVIAQITDIQKGEIILMVGTQDITLHDTDLVQRLLKSFIR